MTYEATEAVYAAHANRKHLESRCVSMGYKTYSCPISRHCGGCELLAVPYPIQLERKRRAVSELFSGIYDCDELQVVGMENPVRYRHKAATPFAPGRKGRVLSGFYAKGTHRIVGCDMCLVEAPACREVLQAVAHIATELHISAYQEDEGRGLLRHAIVRAGYKTDELLLTIVINGSSIHREREFIKRLLGRVPQLTAVAQNSNTRQTNAMLGRTSRALFGGGIMHDELLGCRFEIGPTSFYQTNPEQTELLYRLAIDGLALTSNERLLDAYCGIGSIGLCAARMIDGLEVLGVEKGTSAVADAKRNARINGLDERCHFVAADAGDYMLACAKRAEHFDAVILDPPRAGASPEFLDALVSLSPPKLSYISCNPQTQRRDLGRLLAAGYHIDSLIVVDMFPHTKHIETVCCLRRKRKNSSLDALRHFRMMD